MSKPADLFPSTIEAIGNTPLVEVELSRITRYISGRVAEVILVDQLPQSGSRSGFGRGLSSGGTGAPQNTS
jgi:hypothetical protein